MKYVEKVKGCHVNKVEMRLKADSCLDYAYNQDKRPEQQEKILSHI